MLRKIKFIPQKPGVYIFKDGIGRILYIGKAQNLKRRVQSHFLKNNFFSAQFTDKAADIDWIITRNEKEAFLLENELIKKYQPRYNIQWRDDKSYFYVAFTPDEWPRVLIRHKSRMTSEQRGGIGPFTNGRELRKVLRALRRIIPFRSCKNPYNKPCLQWHLGLCPAHGEVNGKQLTANNYLNSLNLLTQFLRLYAGEKIRVEAYDISDIQGKFATGSMVVFNGARPSKTDYRKFRIKTVPSANDVAMIKEVLRRRLNHPEWSDPDLMLIDGGISQLNAANSIIHTSKFMIPAVALAKREEEIYTEYSDKTLHLSQLPHALRLTFQAIRDEAHRFAIFYYRYLHEKRGFGKSHREIRKKRPRQR